MKHLKSYKLFESQEVINAGIENAIKNNNAKLYNQLIEQYPDMIDYGYIVDFIVKNTQYLYFLEHIPQEYLKNIKSFDGIGKLTTKYFNYLPNLTSLNISNCDLLSLKGIEKLTKLKYLYIQGNDLESLDGVENLTELLRINCSNTMIESLEPLKKLTKLEEFKSIDTYIKSLKGIENCINLIELNVPHNELTTLKEIKDLENLKIIYAAGNPIVNTSVIEVIEDVSTTEYNQKLDVIEIQSYYKSLDN